MAYTSCSTEDEVCGESGHRHGEGMYGAVPVDRWMARLREVHRHLHKSFLFFLHDYCSEVGSASLLSGALVSSVQLTRRMGQREKYFSRVSWERTTPRVPRRETP